jgi:SAM-dependent methyltransferase
MTTIDAATSKTARPNYGLDAPGVVRNLLLVGAAVWLCWTLAALRLWSGTLVVGPIAGVNLVFPLAISGLWAGTGCAAMAVWMIWSSKVGKIRRRERLLQHIPWTGREQVLDVGCGRGLMLIGAAKRLTTGKATGIDIWQAEDLSGNRPDAMLENARLEHVAARVDVRTADMRQMPFPDDTFEVVLSCEAIHNIYSAAERAKAICEIARVLKPGGHALIEDIRHHRDYADTFATHGCRDIRTISSRAVMVLLALITFGSLRPATLLVRKTA